MLQVPATQVGVHAYGTHPTAADKVSLTKAAIGLSKSIEP